jgi:hypothetical protein
MKSVFDHITGQGPLPADFRPAGKLSLETAFAVYRNGYASRLSEALGDIYEVVWKVLGDETFFEVAGTFLRQTPSESHNLGDYSEHFATYIEAHSVTRDFPFLPDLARMAWLHKVVFNAANEIGRNDQQMLALLSEEGATAKFVRGFALFKSEFCVYDLWKCLKENLQTSSAWRIPQCVCFYRTATGDVELRQLDEDSFSALKDLQAGKNILDACENLEAESLTNLFYFLTAQKLLL